MAGIKAFRGRVAIVFLEAEGPEWALRELMAELAASKTPFGKWLGKEMQNLFGCDFTRLSRVADGELLFAWQEVPGEGKQELREDS